MKINFLKAKENIKTIWIAISLSYFYGSVTHSSSDLRFWCGILTYKWIIGFFCFLNLSKKSRNLWIRLIFLQNTWLYSRRLDNQGYTLKLKSLCV
ncbi:hypothetical protein Avbf_04609 [Armadillidium vulgare]|nr:hypothetical protein Avbf_04609 [Armadillidium vulgare]